MHEDVYVLSKRIESLCNLSKLKPSTKAMFKKLREKDSLQKAEIDALASRILRELGVPLIQLTYGGRQPHARTSTRLKKKTYGHYRPTAKAIHLYKFTAVRQEAVKPKTLLDTLLHEICHHLDFTMFHFPTSIHTSGFYKRISSLKYALLNNQ